MGFEFRRLNQLGNRLAISLPLDEEGLLGRECPMKECLGYFKIKLGTGLKGSDLPCHCPYCGHTDPHDRFFTPDQLEYAQSIALRQITQAMVQDLKALEFTSKPKGAFGIGISMKVQPGPPIPIRFYREKALQTSVTCDSCGLEYAVYGVFGFCPDCREHNSLTILLRNLALTRKQLDLAATLADPDFRAHIVEDALENCVSAFDAFAREACRVRASKSSAPAKAESQSFQNLPRVSDRLRTLFGVDYPASVGSTDWDLAHLGFMRRHLIAHRSGVVDQQYLDETHDSHVVVGRRIVIAQPDVQALAVAVERLAATLLNILPPP